MGSEIVVPPPAVAMDDELKAKEFRNDPTGGSDLAVRTRKQLLDGVHAEVVFPNTLLRIGSRPEAARVTQDRMERLSTTVIGMAAGMGPIVHPTGGGVLDGFDLEAIGARIDSIAA